MNRVRKNKKKGFTLVELMIVVVIMIILAAAATPIFKGYVDRAKQATYLANCRTVYVAAQTTSQDWLAGDFLLPTVDPVMNSTTGTGAGSTAHPGATQGLNTEFAANVQALAQLNIAGGETYTIHLDKATGAVNDVTYEDTDYTVTFTPNGTVNVVEK